METNVKKYRLPIFIFVLVFLAWGIAGLTDFKNRATTGYQTDNNFNITKIESGSAAETAGLMVGDHINSIDGISLEDSKSWNEKARPAIGETRPWDIERNGGEMKIPGTYTALPPKDMMLNYAAFALGVIFLLMGLWVFLAAKSRAALLFTFFAVLFGSNFLGGPYIATPTLRNIVDSVQLWLLLLGFAYLVNFLLHYPVQRDFTAKSNSRWIIFGPAVLLGVVFTILNLFQPDYTQPIRTGLNLIIGLVILFYFVWAIVLMVQSYNRASAEERSAKGLGMMLAGVAIGLLPIIVLVLVQTLAPQVVVPGGNYAFLFFAFIPILFGIAVRKVEVGLPAPAAE